MEVDVSPGAIPKTILVGLPEAAVRESTHRVERAIVNCGFQRPYDRVVINLELEVIPVSSLAEAAAFFAGHLDIDPTSSRLQELFNTLSHYDDD